MALIRGANTRPEIAVRRIAHRLGYRFRLHRRDLPGKPDLVFPRRHAVIFVHGCFWHRHPSPRCPLARLPKSRVAFWRAKLDGNRARDVRTRRELKKMGWRVLVVWECQLKNLDRVAAVIRAFMSREGHDARH